MLAALFLITIIQYHIFDRLITNGQFIKTDQARP